jgi:prepilin-type processing-associated H-X9-DG protein
MQVSVTNGGAMELVAAGNVAACFQAMSNELNIPKILLCPDDTHRARATNFSTLNNSNISYFVGLDVTNEANPQMLLSGDDNFAIGGVPVKSGVVQLLTSAPVTWTKARHKFAGNIGLADGSVEQLTTNGLQQALQQTGVATNRLIIP